MSVPEQRTKSRDEHLTKNLSWEPLQRRTTQFLLLLFLFIGFQTGPDARGLPSPASGVAPSQQVEVAVALAEAPSAQTDLLPAQETAARAAEVRGLLHINRGGAGCGPVLRRWWRLGIDERLRDS